MPAAREASDQDRLQFPLLLSLPSLLATDQQHTHSMSPSDIDKLAVESQKAFQRAYVPESTVSIGERNVSR
jgi:hypothetical protein